MSETSPLHVPPAGDLTTAFSREILSVHKEIRDARTEAATASSEVREVKGRLLGFDANDTGEIGELKDGLAGVRRQLWWLIGLLATTMATALVDLLSRIH